VWVSLGTPAAADSTTLAQVAEGELSLQATFDTASTTTGERVSMQLSATNRRSTVATGVVIRVVLPDGLEFVGPPLPDQPAGPRRSWDIGAMDPNTAVSLTADLLVISPGLTSTWVASPSACRWPHYRALPLQLLTRTHLTPSRPPA
jgi:hypothetical protein